MQLQDSRRLWAASALMAALATSACAGGSMSVGAGSGGSSTPSSGGGGSSGGDATTQSAGLQTLSTDAGDGAGDALSEGGNLIRSLGAALAPEADTPIAPVQGFLSQTLTELGAGLDGQGDALSAEGLGGAPLVGSLLQTGIASGDGITSGLLNVQVDGTNVIGGAEGAQPLLALNLQTDNLDALGALGGGVDNAEPLLATDLSGLVDPLLGQADALESTGLLSGLTAPLADPLGLGPTSEAAPTGPAALAEVTAPVTQLTGDVVGGLGGLLGN